MNIRRKTTGGSVVDFPFINTFGFLAYFISNCAFYYSPVIRHQYSLRNKGLTPTVAFNDIVFAGHATLISCILLTQYFKPSLWGLDKAAGRRPSRTILGVVFGSFVAVAAVIFIVVSTPPDADPKTSWAWLDVMYTVSYVKLVVTVVKYAPQLLHNFRTQSTKGWAIGGMLLDFAGGSLSIAQQAIDAYLQRDWSGITGNPVKFALGNVSMLYDLGFMTQHYILYRGDSEEKHEERESLLERGENDRRRD
ncbi:hypothetical protein DL764_006614 [Monosporascus ibericus]|uniref:Lysosomal cystine transporter n=1 Tax=Monosporascus ibericus TaxID=155417 RepID=A0A4Q4T4M1_9PEZI|nr:hypothetical protein DL764_006614 [Monosporascus ibericus]